MLFWSLESSAILMLVSTSFLPPLHQPVKCIWACLKFRLRFHTLFITARCHIFWARFLLQFPHWVSLVMPCYAGQVQLICTKCFVYVKMSILSRICACTSLWKSYMYYNHAYTMSLYHHPECIDFLYFITDFIINFVQCSWRIFHY